MPTSHCQPSQSCSFLDAHKPLPAQVNRVHSLMPRSHYQPGQSCSFLGANKPLPAQSVTFAIIKGIEIWSEHTCHISQCETKSHRIRSIWKPVPIRFFKSHRIFFRPSYNTFDEEININHTSLHLSQASCI